MPHPPRPTRRTRPTLSLGLANFAAAPPEHGWSALVERARAAERAGVDRVVVVDHVVMGEHLEAYDGGRFPTGSDGSWLEPLTVLGVLAGATERVRLATGILIAPLRRPVVLAKAAATLDVLSGGRLDLGVGVGWQREEYDAAGLDFDARGELLDETLALCRALWAPGPTTYASPRFTFDSVWCEPRPVQPGGVPIWVSGRLNRRTLARIVRFGDGWIPWGEHIAGVEEHVGAVHEALAAAGRDPAGFQVRGQLPVGRHVEQAMEAVGRMVAAGVTDFNLGLRLPDDAGEAEDLLAAAVAAFHDAL